MTVSHGTVPLRALLAAPLALLIILLTGCPGEREEARVESQGEKPFIAVVARGFEHEFWSTVRQGSLAAAGELAIPLSFDGPATEEMVDVQIDFLQNAVTRKADAILLAALDSAALVGPVEKAQAAGIAVATFDAGVETEVLFHVGTDNRTGGALAAQHLGELIGGSGEVGVILHDQESETGIERWVGFSEGMRELYPGVEIIPPVVGGGNPERSAGLLRQLLQEHPGLDGVFAANEGSTIGAAMVVGERGGEPKLVGFDASREELELLREGVIDGLVAQDPFNMGYLGVRMLYRHLRGEAVPRMTRTAVTYVTAENLDDPALREVLVPGAPEQ